MTDRLLIATGTVPGSWPAWAEEAMRRAEPTGSLVSLDLRTDDLLERIAQGGHPAAPDGPVGGVAPQAARLLEDVAKRLPKARFVLWAESPTAGLAHALSGGEASDPDAWLAAWCVSARALLRQMQREPARCLVVDAAQARDEPAAVAAAVAAFAGLPALVSAAEPVVPPVDSLAAGLAALLCAVHRESAGLYDELLAACALLGSRPPEAAGAARIDGRAVAVRLRDLLGAEKTYRRVDAECGQLRSRVTVLQEEVAQLGTALAEREALAADLRNQYQAAQRDCEAQQVELALRAKELQQAMLDLEGARGDAELGALQVAQVGEELAHWQGEFERIRREGTFAGVAWYPVVLDGLEPVGERPTPPHRELTLRLHGLQAGGRAVPEATLRLVEHHGHPGLAFFRARGEAPLFDAWRESGREDGVPYMLLVPSDAHCAEAFAALTSHDWLLLEALCARVEAALAALPGRAWRAVARRFRDALADLPDQVRVSGARVLGTDPPVLLLEHVHYGRRALERLTLRWEANAGRARLALLSDPELGAPLPSWPQDASGAPVERVLLPVDADQALPAAHAAWLGLPAAERAFWSALVEALPDIAAQAHPELVDGLSSLRARVTEVARWRPGFARRMRRVLAGRGAPARSPVRVQRSHPA